MAPLTFRNEDEEAQYCLSALRDGTRDEKVDARERLAAIFAQRGLYEEAAELYELNIRAGVRSPEIFEDLSVVYRHLGDHESAEAALVEAKRVRSLTRARAGPDSGQSAPVDGRASPETGLTSRAMSDVEPGVASAEVLVQAQSPREQGTAPPPSDLERPSGSRRSMPGPILATGVVLFMIVLPVMLLALFVVNPLMLYLEGRAAGPTVDATATPLPTLKIAPGMSASWYLQTGRSVSGLWASPGLELTLASGAEGVGRTYIVTAPRSQSWGETITIVERRGQGRSNQATIVPATFEVPANLPPAGTVLDGRIAGQVTAPRLSESSQFTTSTESLDIPVQLVVVSGLDLWLDRFENSLRMFFEEDRWLLVTIGAILTWSVLAGAAAILFRVRRR